MSSKIKIGLVAGLTVLVQTGCAVNEPAAATSQSDVEKQTAPTGETTREEKLSTSFISRVKVIKEEAPVAVPLAQPKSLMIGAYDLFATDSATLSAQGKASLQTAVRKMNDLKINSVEVVGHTDSVGSDSYNEDLSIRRAAAVKAHLVEFGVDAGQIQVQGKGELEPVASNDTSEGRAQNRRVEITFVSGQ